MMASSASSNRLIDREEEEEEEEATDDYSSYWRSIPDPPPPASASMATATAADDAANVMTSSPRLVRRKRNSDSSAFREITNRRDARSGGLASTTLNVGEDDDEDDYLASRTTSKRAAAALREDVGVDGPGDNSSAEMEGEEVGTRRKKRRNHAGHNLDDVVNDATYSTTDNNPTTTTANNTTIPLADISGKNEHDGSNEAETLLQLVRGYSSLPNNNTDGRINSKQQAAAAVKIESISGYPMPNHGRSRPGTTDANTKQEFLLLVQPIVLEMEERKQLDAMDARSSTQCEARKRNGSSKGGGGYCYHDVSSGVEVAPDEYRDRYLRMIDERRRMRRTMVMKGREKEEDGDGESLNRLGDNLEGAKGGGRNHNDDEQVKKSQRGRRCDDSNMDESVNMEDDSMMSLDDSVAYNDDEEKQHSWSSSTTNASNTVLSSAEMQSNFGECNAELAGSDETCQRQDNSHDDGWPGHPLLAEMPPTNDPRVLAARGRLWSALDTALATYSREIMAVEEEQDTGGGDATTTTMAAADSS